LYAGPTTFSFASWQLKQVFFSSKAFISAGTSMEALLAITLLSVVVVCSVLISLLVLELESLVFSSFPDEQAATIKNEAVVNDKIVFFMIDQLLFKNIFKIL
jgi:hypothetical protein